MATYVVLVLGRTAYEGGVDLQAVESESLQISHTRIAGAEIIDGDFEPGLMECADHTDGVAGIGHDRRFGNLEPQQPWVAVSFLENAPYGADDIRAVELLSRDVDCDAQPRPSRFLPGAGLQTRGT